jgi:pimeloyl-ACP methyl ester carboxylesterase
MLLLAVLCAYIAVCALFYHGQWQLVLQPSRSVPQTPATAGLQSIEVHFGVDATGQPQLDGFWIPADASATPRPTALILHGGTGSLSDAIPTAQLLHDAELNVLLFDYRGFGHSLGQHPDQQLMQTDAASALRYLTDTRNIPAASIVVFGDGLGASLAVNLCAAHKDLPALILESPKGDFDQTIRNDPRSRMVPASLLFNQKFPLAAPLQSLRTPKLLISVTTGSTPTNLQNAADPKSTLELPPPASQQTLHDAIVRFLATYLSQPPDTLTPKS